MASQQKHPPSADLSQNPSMWSSDLYMMFGGVLCLTTFPMYVDFDALLQEYIWVAFYAPLLFISLTCLVFHTKKHYREVALVALALLCGLVLSEVELNLDDYAGTGILVSAGVAWYCLGALLGGLNKFNKVVNQSVILILLVTLTLLICYSLVGAVDTSDAKRLYASTMLLNLVIFIGAPRLPAMMKTDLERATLYLSVIAALTLLSFTLILF